MEGEDPGAQGGRGCPLHGAGGRPGGGRQRGNLPGAPGKGGTGGNGGGGGGTAVLSKRDPPPRIFFNKNEYFWRKRCLSL